jgi:hypothetical protein
MDRAKAIHLAVRNYIMPSGISSGSIGSEEIAEVHASYILISGISTKTRR